VADLEEKDDYAGTNPAGGGICKEEEEGIEGQVVLKEK